MLQERLEHFRYVTFCFLAYNEFLARSHNILLLKIPMVDPKLKHSVSLTGILIATKFQLHSLDLLLFTSN